MTRKGSKVLKDITKKLNENPIVEHIDDSPVPAPITTKEHISELQDILVQTCIDYINKNGLTDIWAIHFNVDSLQASAQEGCWCSESDSYIRVEGVRNSRYIRKNGEELKIPFTYTIGEVM